MYESAVGMGVSARGKALAEAFWKMGSRIVNVMQMEAGIRSARYGEHVVERLGKDLTKRHGKGFGRTNMFYIRRFALEVPREQLNGELTWTHYRALLSVADETKREQLRRLAVAQKLSCELLNELVKRELTDGVDGADFLLKPRAGQVGLVKVERDTFGKKGGWVVNGGFHLRKEVVLKGASKLHDGEVVRWKGEGRVERVTCKKTERYCYEARVVRVVDGDTLVLRISCWERIFIDERIRLRGVDAAEVGSSAGKRALAFVKRRLKVGDRVRVQTFGGDRYGRYVGDVFYGEDRVWLNKELVEKGQAKFLDMKVV